jgi:hypothetical protein
MSQDIDRHVFEEIEAQPREQDPVSVQPMRASRRNVVSAAARVAAHSAGWSGVMIAGSRVAAIRLSAVIHRALAAAEPRRSIPPALPR